jgi:hypothetical protein
MTKRAAGKFERNDRDFYRTPRRPILPLLPHLSPGTVFIEPCAGDGALVKVLESEGHFCARAFDIEPQAEGIREGDATTCRDDSADFYITNPPWKVELLHPIIWNLTRSLPTWLLFDADWAHTLQASGLRNVKGFGQRDLLSHCSLIVSVGRVKWIEGSDNQGFDNAAWYLFHRDAGRGPIFIGRKK